MKKFFRLTLVLLFMLSAFAFAACGDNRQQTDDPSENGQQQTTGGSSGNGTPEEKPAADDFALIFAASNFENYTVEAELKLFMLTVSMESKIADGESLVVTGMPPFASAEAYTLENADGSVDIYTKSSVGGNAQPEYIKQHIDASSAEEPIPSGIGGFVPDKERFEKKDGWYVPKDTADTDDYETLLSQFFPLSGFEFDFKFRTSDNKLTDMELNVKASLDDLPDTAGADVSLTADSGASGLPDLGGLLDSLGGLGMSGGELTFTVELEFSSYGGTVVSAPSWTELCEDAAA